MKKILVLFMMLLTLASLVSAQSILVNRAEVVPQYGDIMVNVAVENNYDRAVDRTRFAMTMYDFDVRSIRYADKLDENDPTSKTLIAPAPSNAKNGCYTVRIDVSNDDFRRTKFREICNYNGFWD